MLNLLERPCDLPSDVLDAILRNDMASFIRTTFAELHTGVALVWQLAFLSISTDPVRYRPIMIPAIFEKLVYSIPVIILVLQKRTNPNDLLFAAIDLALGTLFVLAYLRTPRPARN